MPKHLLIMLVCGCLSACSNPKQVEKITMADQQSAYGEGSRISAANVEALEDCGYRNIDINNKYQFALILEKYVSTYEESGKEIKKAWSSKDANQTVNGLVALRHQNDDATCFLLLLGEYERSEKLTIKNNLLPWYRFVNEHMALNGLLANYIEALENPTPQKSSLGFWGRTFQQQIAINSIIVNIINNADPAKPNKNSFELDKKLVNIQLEVEAVSKNYSKAIQSIAFIIGVEQADTSEDLSKILPGKLESIKGVTSAEMLSLINYENEHLNQAILSIPAGAAFLILNRALQASIPLDKINDSTPL